MPPPLDSLPPPPSPERAVYCNRTLNMRSIRAIGYDMDYTLVHYNVLEWEERAYEEVRRKLLDVGWPVDDLRFEPHLVTRGLIIDRALGNLVKANRFGYVVQGGHGTRMLAFDEQRHSYAGTEVDLAEPRWAFLNTLFSMSEAVIYLQLVDLLDERRLPEVLGYSALHDRIRILLDEAHMEGELKAAIVADPERFVVLDEDGPRALQHQREAGKRLLLITNSDWDYTRFMMSYAYDRFLPDDTTWTDLFDLVIISARKPEFFHAASPAFRMVDEAGLLTPCPVGIVEPGIYAAGCAALVEAYLDVEGSEILFVGDHVYGDVHVSKSIRRWRTALVLRELEEEMRAVASFRPTQERLTELMARKERLERGVARLRMAAELSDRPDAQTAARLQQARAALMALDETIGPLARASASLFSERWGLLMRAGNDKSHLARQVERHADVYTSRASNFLFETPFAYFRAPRGSLPHDPGVTPDPWARAAPGTADEVGEVAPVPTDGGTPAGAL